MQKHFITIISAFLFMACNENSPTASKQQGAADTAVDTVAVSNDPKKYLNIQTRSFTEIDSSGILIFPLSMSESERSTGSLVYKEIADNNYWNIIFLNSKTNEYHLLTDHKIVIRNDDFARNTTKNQLYYLATSDDYNNDRKLTDEDPTYLFASDKDGNNFRRVSPSGCDIQNWEFIKSSNKIVLTAKKDSDKNNSFDDKDEVAAFEVDIDKGTEAKEIFSTEFKVRLKILYDRDWKRLKD